MRTFGSLLLIAFAFAGSGPVRAAVTTPDASASTRTAPMFASDRIELRLDAAAAATARAAAALRARDEGAARIERLGVAAVDRVAADLGGATFETEFRGETAPPPGSSDIDFTAFFIVHLPAGADPHDAARRFRGLREVRAADPIAQLPVAAVPNDSMWNLQYWLYQPSRRDIHAPEAWEVTTGDTSVVVGVLDTGVVPYHPDIGGLAGGPLGNLYINWAEKNGLPGVDDDNNGFVDDVSGWDFVNLPTGTGVAQYEDWRDQDNDPNDFAGHGTAVAGLIGAITNNVSGVAGAAWKVRIMPLRMAWSATCCPLGLVDMSFAAQAIRYATRMGVQVLNCSWASANQSGIDAAVTAATHAGVVVVSASGNNGGQHYLPDRLDVISVAATNANDQIPSFSNVGSYVDLSAPGVSMYSTAIARLAATDSVSQRQPGYTPISSSLNGTSFSSPLVVGTVALMEAQRRAQGLRPLQPMAVQLRLRETTDDISDVNPTLVGAYGTGRLNMYRALTDPPGSSAWRAGAASVGPAVAYSIGEGTRLAWLMNNQTLLIVDAASGDTLSVTPLPAPPVAPLSVADLGGGRGLGLFAGTTAGKVLGFDALGQPLPNWPVTGPDLIFAGPAIGDLDGDGTNEIVCGDFQGKVWAWHANGSRVTGFPAPTNATGVGTGVALSDLDGLPGVEIVAATRDGEIHALTGDGGELAGWPFTVGGQPVAPVVTRWNDALVVLVASGGQLVALGADGVLRFVTPLAGTAVQDPALADLNANGSDEIAIATSSNNTIQVIDSTGVDLDTLNWPARLTSGPLGPPVIGHLRGGSEADVLVMTAGGLAAFSDSATTIATFPKPGGAGSFPTLLELDGDGATEVVAGTGIDSSLFVYDASPGSWDASPQPWPTARGNFARTGSRLYAPAPDVTSPAPVADLSAVAVTTDSIALAWTAPGDDGAIGRAASYELRVTNLSPGFPPSGGSLLAGVPAPLSAGSPQSMRIGGLSPNTTYYFWIVARDDAGNVATASNVAAALTPLGPPLVVDDLVVASASDTSVTLRWSSPAIAGTLGYEVRGATQVLNAANFSAAPLHLETTDAAPPGNSEQVTFNGLTRRTRYWFALRPRGIVGQPASVSNVASVETHPYVRLAGIAGPGIVTRRQPSPRPVEFVWQSGGAPVQRIVLFDLSGRRVRSIPLGSGPDGATQWDGRDDESRLVPAGLYFARLISGSVHVQTRVVLLP